MKLSKDVLSKATVDERALYSGYHSGIAFGKQFLSGDFDKSETPWFHYLIDEELNSDSNKPLGISLPRGHAKTTLIKANLVKDFCYTKKALLHFASMASIPELKEFWEWAAERRRMLFYAWVAKSQSDSVDNVRYIALHLTSNPKILFWFGFGESMRGKIWNMEDITTLEGDRLMSSSNLKSIRGKTEATIEYGSIRFDRVFADDFENEQNTKTFQSRQELKRTLLAATLPAIETNYPRCRICVIGTPCHGDSFIQNLINVYDKFKNDPLELENYSWKLFVWKATQPDKEGGVLWHSWRPRAELDKIKKRYEVDSHLGLALYYQEYELEVQSGDTARWTRNHLKFWKGVYQHEDNINYIVIDGNRRPVNTFIGVDPATDIDNETSDESSLMVIAMDEFQNIYELDGYHRKDMPNTGIKQEDGSFLNDKPGIIDKYVELYDKYKCKHGTIEQVSITQSVFQDLFAYNHRTKRKDIITRGEPPGNTTSKRSRIYSTLNRYFAAGQMYYRENSFDLIHQTLQMGPRMAHDDIIDSLHLACKAIYPPKFEFESGEWKKPSSKPRRKRSWITM